MTIIRQISLCVTLLLCLNATVNGSIKQEEIIPMLGCRACHQFSAEGNRFAPSLTAIGQRKTREELLHTLKARDKTTAEHHMPSYDYLSDEDLQQLLNVLEQP